VTCFEKVAASVAKYCQKGKRVSVSGRLNENRWEDKDGNKRSQLEVIAHSVGFLDSAKDDTPADDKAPW